MPKPQFLTLRSQGKRVPVRTTTHSIGEIKFYLEDGAIVEVYDEIVAGTHYQLTNGTVSQ